MESRTLRIENMHCGACVRRVTMALNKIPGTSADEVEVGMARVRTDSPGETLLAALAKAGYPAHLE